MTHHLGHGLAAHRDQNPGPIPRPQGLVAPIRYQPILDHGLLDDPKLFLGDRVVQISIMEIGQDLHTLLVPVLVDSVSWGFRKSQSAESEDEPTDTLDGEGDSPGGVRLDVRAEVVNPLSDFICQQTFLYIGPRSCSRSTRRIQRSVGGQGVNSSSHMQSAYSGTHVQGEFDTRQFPSLRTEGRFSGSFYYHQPSTDSHDPPARSRSDTWARPSSKAPPLIR